METKQMLIGGAVILAILLGLPVLFNNWPRDPKPEADAPVLAQFNSAIVQYRNDMGVLPKRLDQLKPTYMTAIPLASNRKPFEYNPNTGEVTPPYPVKPEYVEFMPNAGSGIGATGPMGEIMTGISIQNELQ